MPQRSSPYSFPGCKHRKARCGHHSYGNPAEHGQPEDSGDLIVSPVAHKPSLSRMGVETEGVVNVGSFTEGQRQFLDYHRSAVLLRAMR
jgi:hypothetical protein